MLLVSLTRFGPAGSARGSAKTTALILDCLSHCETFAEHAAPLVCRESHAGLIQISDELYLLARQAWGDAVRRNKAENTITLPNYAVITFTQISDMESYIKHQGKNYSALYLEEASNYALSAWEYVDKLRASLRPPLGQRPHLHLTANPWGLSHSKILRDHIEKAPFWKPYCVNGIWWINTHTSFKDNPHIDQEAFERELLAACAGDENMVAAWIRGEWSQIGGSMFAPPWDQSIHVIDNPTRLPDVRWMVGVEWGLSSMSWAGLGAKLKQPWGNHVAGTVFVIDEVHSCPDGSWANGDGSPPEVLAEMIAECLARNGAPRGTQVVVDDMRGLHGATDSVVEIFRACGLSATKPNKAGGRSRGWVNIRSLLHNAKEQNGGPGLYIADRCESLIMTLPAAPRNKRRTSDLDPSWDQDHASDGLSYLITALTGGYARQGTYITN